jgi:transcriptional regulator with XRE-family HTH domain
MHSLKKTVVAVLRQMIGLNVEDFGKLIGKSVSTVTKLNNGQLPLSEETAQRIATETGVSIDWLLANDPKITPYVTEGVPFEKERFELIQAGKMSRPPITCESLTKDIIAIYRAAAAVGKLELVDYHVRKFLGELKSRLAKPATAPVPTSSVHSARYPTLRGVAG